MKPLQNEPVIGINGFGRMGFCAVRLAKEFGFKIGAINASRTPEQIAYLLKYDTVHGKYPGTIFPGEDCIYVDEQKIPLTSERDPKNIPWSKYGVQYVMECTGKFLTTESVQGHFAGGAEKVIISAPPKDDTPMFVYGVNHDKYMPDMKVVSGASCTTNCLAPIVKILSDAFGIESGFMITTHAVTSKQKSVDGFVEKDWRIGRSIDNIIPSTTGAAKAVGKVIPEVKGILTGTSNRVPVQDGSQVSLTVNFKQSVTNEMICDAVLKATTKEMNDVVEYSTEEIVSHDIIGNLHPCIFDAKFVNSVTPTFANIIAWYDNEMSYVAQLFRMLRYMN